MYAVAGAGGVEEAEEFAVDAVMGWGFETRAMKRP